jgi:hypothetical protein
MRVPLLCLALAMVSSLPLSAYAQEEARVLASALRGEWVGVLEYRDYSEPAGSTKRVDLPTWLTISGDTAQRWHYTYDDGPTKIVEEEDTILFDFARQVFSEASDGKTPHIYRVTGLEALKAGRGTLQMISLRNDNGKPSEVHLVMTVGRNLLEILQEVRPADSAKPYAFRHVYRMVRAQKPTKP